VTNAHVVRGADQIRVVLADRREFEAKLVTQDERYDIALLRIENSGEKFPSSNCAIRIDRSRRRGAGDRQIHSGSPDGNQRDHLRGCP